MKALNKADSMYALRWAKKIKAIDMLGGVCEKCGENNCMVLEFHHKNGEEKEFSFNDKINGRWSMIEPELPKCMVLCRNCHSEIHSGGNKRNVKIKKKLLEIKGVSSCLICGYDKNVGVLDFHHKRDKEFHVNCSRVRHADVSLEDIILEIDKCEVLCSNCHILKQINQKRFNRLKPYIDYKIDNYKELRPELDKDLIYDMYFNQGMRQVDIVRHFDCSKGTISGIIKKLKSSK